MFQFYFCNASVTFFKASQLFCFGFLFSEFWGDFLTEVKSIYDVALISPIYRRVTQLYTFFFIFFSIMVYHRILNIVPCAIQEDFVVYPFYI